MQDGRFLSNSTSQLLLRLATYNAKHGVFGIVRITVAWSGPGNIISTMRVHSLAVSPYLTAHNRRADCVPAPTLSCCLPCLLAALCCLSAADRIANTLPRWPQEKARPIQQHVVNSMSHLLSSISPDPSLLELVLKPRASQGLA